MHDAELRERLDKIDATQNKMKSAITKIAKAADVKLPKWSEELVDDSTEKTDEE